MIPRPRPWWSWLHGSGCSLPPIGPQRLSLRCWTASCAATLRHTGSITTASADCIKPRRISTSGMSLDPPCARLLPQLCAAVEAQPDNSAWTERLSHLIAAWDWAATGAWVVAQEQVDVNALQGRLDRIEDRIRGQVERLAATRAWGHAVSPERLTGTAQADLAQYA